MQVALAPLPRPPRPRPPRPLFPPRPARPAFVSRPMSSGILGFSFRGISTILFSCSSKGPSDSRTNFSHEQTFLVSVPTDAVFPRGGGRRRETTRGGWVMGGAPPPPLRTPTLGRWPRGDCTLRTTLLNNYYLHLLSLVVSTYGTYY